MYQNSNNPDYDQSRFKPDKAAYLPIAAVMLILAVAVAAYLVITHPI